MHEYKQCKFLMLNLFFDYTYNFCSEFADGILGKANQVTHIPLTAGRELDVKCYITKLSIFFLSPMHTGKKLIPFISFLGGNM